MGEIRLLSMCACGTEAMSTPSSSRIQVKKALGTADTVQINFACWPTSAAAFAVAALSLTISGFSAKNFQIHFHK